METVNRNKLKIKDIITVVLLALIKVSLQRTAPHL